MPRWKSWLPGLALLAATLAVGLLSKRPAQATQCLADFASLEIETVTVAGVAASTLPYGAEDPSARPQVIVWGTPEGVRLTFGTFQGEYEEIYRAPGDAAP